MKKLVLAFISVLIVSAGAVNAAEYCQNFNSLDIGSITETSGSINGFSYDKKITVKSDGNDKYMQNANEISLKIPENSRKITVSARVRAEDFSKMRFPLAFFGGKRSDSLYRDYVLLKNNAWDGGISLNPQNSITLKDSDTVLLLKGWGRRISENDNDIYVYKNEWFYPGIEYDYTTNLFKVYYSYDGIKYRETYSEEIENVRDCEETVIRSVRFSEGLCYDDIKVVCDSDEIYNIRVCDDSKNEVHPESGKNFAVYADAYTPDGNLTSVKSIAALYDKTTNALLEVHETTADIGAEKNNFMGSFEFKSSFSNAYIKYFVFESFENMIPCCTAAILS